MLSQICSLWEGKMVKLEDKAKYLGPPICHWDLLFWSHGLISVIYFKRPILNFPCALDGVRIHQNHRYHTRLKFQKNRSIFPLNFEIFYATFLKPENAENVINGFQRIWRQSYVHKTQKKQKNVGLPAKQNSFKKLSKYYG